MNSNVIAAIVYGTRPEFIKLKELINLIKKSALSDQVIIVNTGQHKELLDMQTELSGTLIDECLQIERAHGGLSFLTGKCLLEFTALQKKYPNLQYLIGQGDTNTVLSLSLFAYLENLKFIHIEAGLRTHNLYDPYPEEFNRKIGALVAYFNFAPSIDAQENLLREGVALDKIMLTGNTGIDALYNTFNADKLKAHSIPTHSILVTIHRRERDDHRVIQLANILNDLLTDNVISKVTWVMHPNYADALKCALQDCRQINYLPALTYDQFIQLYEEVSHVITDSGGVTEEALTIGIPTTIFRKFSERYIPPHIQNQVLISTDIHAIERHLTFSQPSERKGTDYFGNGTASKKIFAWLEKELG